MPVTQITYPGSPGRTDLFVVVSDSANNNEATTATPARAYNKLTSAYEAYSSANLTTAKYLLPLLDTGTPGEYSASVPSGAQAAITASRVLRNTGSGYVLVGGETGLGSGGGTGGVGLTDREDAMLRDLRAKAVGSSDYPVFKNTDGSPRLTEIKVGITRTFDRADAMPSADTSGLTTQQSALLYETWAYHIGDATRTGTGDIYQGPDAEERVKLVYADSDSRTVEVLAG